MVSDNINCNMVNMDNMDNTNFENNILENMYNFFNKPENLYLKEYVKNFNEPNGFFSCHSNEFTEICNGVDENNNLDNSIVLFLRKCQYIFTHE